MTSKKDDDEKTPLVSEPAAAPSSTSPSSSFYFLQRSGSSSNKSQERIITYDAIESTSESTPSGSKQTSVSLDDGSVITTEEVLNLMPSGANKEEFDSRPIFQNLPSSEKKGSKFGFLGSIFGRSGRPGGSSPSGAATQPQTPHLVKPRAVPIKVEPKVFFANERTFLAWMHASVLLAGASIAIIAFADANPWSQVYGVMLLPVSICFIVYAMYQYTRRAYMIRKRLPGPYEDIMGPTVLSIMLMISIVANFALKLYSVLS